MDDELRFPATALMHTPSGATPVCEKHGQAGKAIFGMLGGYVNFTILDEPTECQNCINAQPKAKP